MSSSLVGATSGAVVGGIIGNKSDLKKFAETLKEYPDTDLLIAGHTDNIGSNGFNQTLSQKRAASVSDYLSDLDIRNRRLKQKAEVRLNLLSRTTQTTTAHKTAGQKLPSTPMTL
jgi:flagellar motor protein MotB